MQTEICENDHNHKPFRLLNLWEKGRGEGTFTISSRRSMLAGVDTDGAKLFLNEEATFHSANCMFVHCTIEQYFIHARVAVQLPTNNYITIATTIDMA